MKDKKAKSQSPPAVAADPVAYRPVTADELRGMCGAPLTCEFVLNGQRVSFTGTPLRPWQRERITLLLEAALPKELPAEEPGGEPRYDFRDPEYRAAKEKHRRTARALALWWAFPLIFFAGANLPPAPSDDQVREHLERAEWDEGLLDMAFTVATESRTLVDPDRLVQASRVGFTSGGGSPAN